MKQVWQANDGTIFDNQKDCEAYEDRIADWENLQTIILANFSLEKWAMWEEITSTIIANKGKSLLFRYIKTLGEKNGN